jgi:chromosome segregation ATPase
VNAAIVSAAIAALAAVLAGVMSLRTAGKANATNDRKVDLEEHRDAIDRLKKIIEDQDRHFDRVRTQLERVQDQLAKEQDVSATLRHQIYSLQEQVNELMRSRARLEEMLAAGTKTAPSAIDRPPV